MEGALEDPLVKDPSIDDSVDVVKGKFFETPTRRNLAKTLFVFKIPRRKLFPTA